MSSKRQTLLLLNTISKALCYQPALSEKSGTVVNGFGKFGIFQIGKQWSKQQGQLFQQLRRRSSYAANVATETVASSQGGQWKILTEGLTNSQRIQIGSWLGICSAWVFSMVVLGGVTRLTRSGLSMTDWKFTGEKYPKSQEDWLDEFAKYKKSPEYQKLNSNMTLDEFKFIFWMEYVHRMWGRYLGVIFAIPATYFGIRGWITRPMAWRLGLIFSMGGAQGLVGWWMVRSGLKHELNEQELQLFEEPKVSPYRLAAHLLSAFTIYSTLTWTTFSVFNPILPKQLNSASQILRQRLIPLSVLVGVTAVSGAFVAGLRAGLAYNDFPFMAGQLFPEQYFDVKGWRNVFENTAAVQFNHRILALSTLASVSGLWFFTNKAALSTTSRLLLNTLMLCAWGQVALGISTLMYYVPVSLGSLHQTGALTIFTVMLALLHQLRPVGIPLNATASVAAIMAVGGVGYAVTQT
eukprot:TRINITY_DN7440_c0_g1_i2.p1 TRINITY_DN7440_c0_g1~~TRINITY_DN7440_c0_g1_i2.p1  ORF type:complete len:490 (-),score=47.00 TRINITY_DN7440_c0_g1_i2:552-1946(-)